MRFGRRSIVLSFLALPCVIPNLAQADEGALTMDVGVGAALLNVPAPYATGKPSVLGFAPSFQLGARYAVRTWFEVSLLAFYEAPGTYYDHGVSVKTADGTFPGVLTYQLQRFGALAGARVQTGAVFHLVAGFNAGWSHRIYSSFSELDDSDPSNITAYSFKLANVNDDNLVVAPFAGIEWAAGDHWSFSLLPRFEYLLGKDSTWVVNVPLSFSWSWYL